MAAEPLADGLTPTRPEQAVGRGAAFFDLDKTLMEGSSAFQFARAVYQAGLMSRRQLASDGWANLRYRLSGASDSQSQELRDRIAASLEGVRVRDLERLGWRVLRGILPRLHPEMLEIAYDHQDQGRRVYIVTAAAQELAEVLAHVMAFDGAIGSHFSDSKDGVYTGQASGLFVYGEAKAVAMAEMAKSQGIDLAASYAYSDSASDLPMLRAVGHPVVVSPDADLRRLARQEGWSIMHLDPLRRQVTVAGALAGAAAAGGVISAVLSSRERRRALAHAVPAPKRVKRLARRGRSLTRR
ncbi:MAG TPA: HAD-IB family hydrolase [Solirubrobacteraceae bacterium]|jgi:HAD superfamily hydrolase (TIGR01490 family)|nr:HAD-IB family hydrolase [Solirubrobacteraceae bacterium]